MTKVLDWLKSIYGNTMTISHGWVHNYLGTRMDILVKGKVWISIANYLKEVIADFPEEIEGNVATPAADHLFDIRPEAK